MKFVELYDTARPYIACFVILRSDNKIAMVLRKNTGYMDGFYGLPAGKVEYGETYIQGAIREAKEEAGVVIEESSLRFVHTVHRHGEERGGFMDWVDIYFEADSWQGEPYNAEELKSERLDWIDLSKLADNIVPHQKEVLLHINEGSFYSEYGW
jgi:8-oxo-dGTP pyrophosphatase MutT (NUDIX family)